MPETKLSLRSLPDTEWAQIARWVYETIPTDESRLTFVMTFTEPLEERLARARKVIETYQWIQANFDRIDHTPPRSYSNYIIALSDLNVCIETIRILESSLNNAEALERRSREGLIILGVTVIKPNQGNAGNARQTEAALREQVNIQSGKLVQFADVALQRLRIVERDFIAELAAMHAEDFSQENSAEEKKAA